MKRWGQAPAYSTSIAAEENGKSSNVEFTIFSSTHAAIVTNPNIQMALSFWWPAPMTLQWRTNSFKNKCLYWLQWSHHQKSLFTRESQIECEKFVHSKKIRLIG